MPPSLSRDLPLSIDTDTDDDARARSRRPGLRSRRAAAVAALAGAGLLTAAAPAMAVPSAPNTLLKTGSHGQDVKLVQHKLHQPASGHFTKRTRRAVLAFQRHDGLAVDGIVGQQTWDALFHITPPPAPVSSAPVSSTTAGTEQTAGSGGYTVPSSIVQCESGGNYGAVNASSGAGGAYQILPSTWAAYGGQGLPQDASPAEQGQIAAEIYAHQGPSAWSCG